MSADSYRWDLTIQNFAKETDAGVRPSDYKTGDFKDITPELRFEIITQTQQQDEWADVVERFWRNRFSAKKFALNCFLQRSKPMMKSILDYIQKNHLRQTEV